jgi:hypothetical protein
MGNRIPGPVCGSRLGPDWIDPGTTCRSKSSPPGPAGHQAAGSGSATAGSAQRSSSAVPGAKPRPRRCPGPKNIKKAIRLIKQSPLADVDNDYGHEIIRLLDLYEQRAGERYRDGIRYKNVEGARGEWTGIGIGIRRDFCGNIEGTILELVHEASHARFAQTNPLPDRSRESIIQNETDSELYSILNQIDIYNWLRERNPNFIDQRMEQRIWLLQSGKLRQVIEYTVKSDRPPHEVDGGSNPDVVEPGAEEEQKNRIEPSVIEIEPPR